MAKVYCTAELPGDGFVALRDAHGVEVYQGPQPIPRETLVQGVRGAEAMVCLLTDRIDARVLDAAGPGLKVVGTVSVGVDHVDLDACRERGVRVTNTPGVLTDATADLTWALILSTVRRVLEGDRLVREGRFSGWRHDLLLGLDLAGATLGVVGFGRIGRAVARRAEGFGMQVLVCGRSRVRDLPPGAQQVGLDELLGRSDVVTLHVPLTPETRGMIGRERLWLMKPGAYLINTSRGAVVDEAALVDALERGRLAGAGLDVYEHEPEVHPGLIGLPNVVLLPHLGSAGRATRTRMADMVCRDVMAVLAGQEPAYPVV